MRLAPEVIWFPHKGCTSLPRAAKPLWTYQLPCVKVQNPMMCLVGFRLKPHTLVPFSLTPHHKYSTRSRLAFTQRAIREGHLDTREAPSPSEKSTFPCLCGVAVRLEWETRPAVTHTPAQGSTRIYLFGYMHERIEKTTCLHRPAG